MLGDAGPGGSAMGRHRFTADAGHHLAPGALSSGASVHDALGDKFTLLAFDANPSILAGFVRAASDIAMPLMVVRDAAQPLSDHYGAGLILVSTRRLHRMDGPLRSTRLSD